MAKIKVCLDCAREFFLETDCAREYPASGVDRPKLSSVFLGELSSDFGRPYLASHGPGLCVFHMQLGMSLYPLYLGKKRNLTNIYD